MKVTVYFRLAIAMIYLRLSFSFSYIVSSRMLITALHEVGKADVIDSLHGLVSATHPQPSIPNSGENEMPVMDSATPPTASTQFTLKEDRLLAAYGGYLKKRHLQVHTTVSTNKFLPSPTRKIFNLAIIKKKRIQYGKIDDEFVLKTVKGHIDDILFEKSPIKLENIFMNIEGERKVVLVDGAPGSGKSTMTVHICQRWGKGELFQEFTIVILVQLQDPAVQRAKSIADLLPCRNDEMAHQIASAITAIDGRGILWVMDGWDELPAQLRQESFLRDIIIPSTKSPITLSSVIVTSRPISSGDLIESVSSRIEVLGFTLEEQRQYFTECLKGDTKAVDDLMERLNENPTIEGSCYLPLNASIVAHLYLSDGSLPTTTHGIFSSLAKHILSRYICERLGKIQVPASLDNLPPELQGAFNEMCKIAFEGTRENKVTFSHSDLEAVKESTIICEMGLLQAIPSIITDGKIVYYHFIHLSIQEYLSALYIAMLPASEQISVFNTLLGNSHFSAVFQFYSAITKLHISTPLLGRLPYWLGPISAGIWDLVRKIIKRKNKVSSEPLLVSLLHALVEAQDSSLCQFVIEQMDMLNLRNTSLTPANCLAIGYFISTISLIATNVKDFNVCLDSCSLGDAGIKSLMRSICRHINPHSTINTRISLLLDNNDIHEEGASDIADVLNSTSLVSRLSLSCNPIGDKGLETIFNALKQDKTLKHLNVSSCRMTDTGIASLAESLKTNSTLEELYIDDNKEITDKGLTDLTQILSSSSGTMTLVVPIHLEVEEVRNMINKERKRRGQKSMIVTYKFTEYEQKKHLAVVKEAIYKKESLTHTTVHCAIVGLARSGKDSFMKRLLGEMPPRNSQSAGVAENIIHVKVEKSSTLSVNVEKSNAVSANSEIKWTKLLYYDDEVLQMMTHLTARQKLVTSCVGVSSNKENDKEGGSADNKSMQTREQMSASDQVHSDVEKHNSTHVFTPTQHEATSHDSKISHELELQSETATHKSPMKIFSEALKKKGVEGLQQHLENNCSLYLSNTGRQIHELLPMMVSGPSLILITFRLDQDLNRQYEIEYEVIVQADGSSKPKTFKHTSSATPLETILQTLATYDAIDYSQQQREKIFLTYNKYFIIGTHQDILIRSMHSKEAVASMIYKIDKEIYEAVQDATYFQNIEFATRNQLIFTVNNFSESDSDFQLIRSSIQRVIDRGYFRMVSPSCWHIYSLVLRQLNSRIESYENCFRIARECGITSHEEHKEALHFIHTKMGVIRYFQQDELDQIVFLDPQVLFDKVTELITNTFTFEKAGKHIESDFKKGMFSFSNLEKLLCSDPLLTPSRFAKLLEHLRIATPFYQDGCLNYFFPCAIAHADKPCKPSPQSSLCPIPPLVVSFECGYRPMGLAGALITYLITNERQSEDFTWKLSTNDIFRDQVSFLIEPSCDTVILKLFPSHLEVTFIPDPNDHNRYYSSIETVCSEVWRTIEAGIGRVNSDINYIRSTESSFTFYCQVQDCKVAKPHPAKLYPGKLFCPNSQTSCQLPEGYERWVVHELPKNNKDTDAQYYNVSDLARLLSQLEHHAAEWRDVGTHLGFIPGELDIIQGNPILLQGAPVSWLSAMLKEWLQWAPGDKRGSKNYATVNSLKSALREANLGKTADELSWQRTMRAVHEAIERQGSLTYTTVHGVIVGLAESGKYSLMKRFVGEMPTGKSPSTGVAEKVIHVKVEKSYTSDPEELKWTKLIHYDDEAVQLLTTLTAKQTLTVETPHVRMSHKKENDMNVKSVDNKTKQTKQQESRCDQVYTEKQESKDYVGIPVQIESKTSYNKHKLYTHSETITPKSPMDIFKEALKNKGLEGLQQHLEDHCSLYLSNTGGQMKVQELLPLVVSGPSLIFVTFRLDQDLNQQYEIEYEVIVQADGSSKPKTFKYKSSATPLETILQTLATYDAIGTFDYSQLQRERVALTYKVFIIGTHRDILKRSLLCDEAVVSKINEINNEIFEAVRGATYFQNIEFATDSRSQLIFTVNNFSESESDFHKIRSSVQNVIDRGTFRMTTPSHWLIYSLVLRQHKNRIESYENCFRIARDCGITSHEEHKEALHFFHTKMGVIRYFQQGELDQIVFLDPQVLFHKVTELITNTFTFEEKAEKQIENDFKKGIFSFSNLKQLLCSDPLLTPSCFAKLLEHLRIAAPFYQDECLKYFFPCAIAHADEPDKPSPQSSLCPIPPLVVSFECGYRPMGLAGALITYLMTNERQFEIKDFKWNLVTDTIFRNQVSFFIEPLYDTVILKLFPSHLEVTFIPKPDRNDRDCNFCPVETVCCEVWKTIQAGIGRVNSDINYISNTKLSFTFYCQVRDCNFAKPHPAKFCLG